MWSWKKPKGQPGIVVHWAGDQFTFRRVSVQRCLWCGALIEHKDWSKIEIPGVEGKTYEQVKGEMFDGTFGGFVGVDQTGYTFHVPIPSNGVPPENACMWEGYSREEIAKAQSLAPEASTGSDDDRT